MPERASTVGSDHATPGRAAIKATASTRRMIGRFMCCLRAAVSVERTLFLLDYLSSADLRQHIRAETTKVESYHQFTDWIAFGGPVLRTGDPVEQEKRIKYRDLVANAIMLHNVVDMTNVLVALHQEGVCVTPEAVSRPRAAHGGVALVS